MRNGVSGRADIISMQETGIGGLQEATFEIEGKGAYSQLKFEGGVHRVQRVPDDRIQRTHSDIYRDRRGSAGSRRGRGGA